MATYAIGDVQGCYEELCRLLEVIAFDESTDELWFLGDLINRGPDNVAVMRLVMSLNDRVRCVLGNHDLHFLAIPLGGHKPNRSDTFQDLLEAPDADEVIGWYCSQPLLVQDASLGYVMTHAGIPHLWDLEQAAARAREVEAVISRRDAGYFEELYGNDPPLWSDDLTGMRRLRSITNYFTRMRLVRPDGSLDFTHKGGLDDAPAGLKPWYEARADKPLNMTILFGHWAALQGHTGHDRIVALDTGCVWGRDLTAICLETGQFHRVPSLTASG